MNPTRADLPLDLKRKRESSDQSDEPVVESFKRIRQSIFSPLPEKPDFIRLAHEHRKVELRFPCYVEKDYLFTDLYSGTFDDADLTEEEFDLLLKENGQLARNGQAHTMIVLQPHGESEFCAAIHYGIQKIAADVNELAIHALDVLPHHQDKHYGSLLLCFAISHAQKESCTVVNLKTTDQGNYIYAAFGFQPQCNDDIPDGAWNKLPYLVKVKILKQCTEANRYLTLNLQDETVQSIVQERLNKALSSSQNSHKDRACLEEVEIPEEAYEWDIFLPEYETDEEE